jgi:putative ABC transport system permease protein
MQDSDTIARDVPGLAEVAPLQSRSVTVVNGNRNSTTSVMGATNAYLQSREWPLVAGHTFTVTDVRAGKAVCVIGQTVREELFGAQDPIGAAIRVDKISCEVIGLLEAKGQSSFGQDQDDIVIMPPKAVQRRIAGNTDVSMIWISVARASDVGKARDAITKVLSERRHIAKGAAPDFQVQDMQEISRMVASTTGILTAFLAAVAAVSLLVGGIGIMNIMLVSVTERTREIGIRLAIGARAHDVLLQFLIEAVVMSGLGGLVGIGVGLAGSALGARALDLPFVFEPFVIVGAALFSAAVGVGFGFFPARRAARLDPIEALRHE